MSTNSTLAFARDDYRCRVCGSEYGVHAHHIVYRSLLGEDAVGNYVTLCARCHEEEHDKRIELQLSYSATGELVEVFVQRRKP